MLLFIQLTLEELSCQLTLMVLSCLLEQPLSQLLWLSFEGSDAAKSSASLKSFIDWLSQRPLPLLQRAFIQGLPFSSDGQVTLERVLLLFAQLPALQAIQIGLGMPLLKIGHILEAHSSLASSRKINRKQLFKCLEDLEVAIESEEMPALDCLLHCIINFSLDVGGSKPV
jgi:hypothetical protein